MIHDNLIDTIIKRGDEKLDNSDNIGATKIYARAWKKMSDNISKDNIKSIKEYETMYESDYIVSEWLCVYMDILQDCFEETGDKKYLEECVNIINNYEQFFATDIYLHFQMSISSSKAKFYLGRKKEVVQDLKELLVKYDNFDEIYAILSDFYEQMDMVKEAKKVLVTGIEKCEFNVYLREKLELLEKNR